MSDAARPRRTLPSRKLPPRPLIDNGDGTHLVPLSRCLFAIIDSLDAADVGGHRWYAQTSSTHSLVYAARVERRPDGKRVTVAMHRQLMGPLDARFVDHINGNGLDNRRVNLRMATNAQNQWNRKTSRSNPLGLKGVSWERRTCKWRARIGANGVNIMIGTFDTPEAAHEAYCEAARRLHGEFARTA